MEKDLYSQDKRRLEKSRYILIDMKTLRVDLIRPNTELSILPFDITDSTNNKCYDDLADNIADIIEDFKNNL